MSINKNFFSSLRWRIAFAYLILIGIGFVVINIFIIRGFESSQTYDKQERFRAYAVQVAQVISKNYSSDDIQVKADVIYDIEELGDDIMYREGGQPTRVLVLDGNGIVDFDSYNDLSEDGFLKRNLSKEYPIIDRVLTGVNVDPTALYIDDKASGEKWVMYSYAPISYESQTVIGAVIISTSLSDIEEIMNTINSMLYRLSFIILIFIMIISFAISAYIASPIKSLTTVIRKMGRGHLDQRVNIRGGGEFRELGDAFNTMSEKLEDLDRARNEFVSNASHELKTPLSAIKVLAESLIHLGGDVPDIYIDFLNDINNEIDRLNSIITDLLALVNMDSKGKTLRFDVVDLPDLTIKTVNGLKILAQRKNMILDMTIANSIKIMGDSTRLQQVISNLVDNAIKYTPEGGRVQIDVYEVDNQAILKVSDTGMGIPYKDIPHIFDRFFRVDKARSRDTGGTGLGLAIAHKIILLHDGSIEVDSKEDRGTTFFVHLPIWTKDLKEIDDI
ncbi:MAG TPA: HAMP domain-containing sensor histidine kinase [Clostridia bacterium]|nr:HAMP domain-containing sensor histidine kinase [Clostridia bacterium]